LFGALKVRDLPQQADKNTYNGNSINKRNPKSIPFKKAWTNYDIIRFILARYEWKL